MHCYNRGVETTQIALAQPPGTDGETAVTRLLLGWLMNQESPNTRMAYARDTDPALLPLITDRPARPLARPRAARAPAWRHWCDAAGAHPVTGITRDHVALYARVLEAAGLPASTRARKLTAVSSWYAWLAEGGVIDVNPAAHVKRPKVDRQVSQTPGLTERQAVALLHAADSYRGESRLRTSALIAVMLYSGARVSEVLNADVEDLSMSQGHRVLWVTRKGGKRQSLLLTSPVTGRLDAYLASRGDMEALPAVPGQPGAPRPRRVLFVTGQGRRLSRGNIWDLVRRLARAAGFPPELTAQMCAHVLRHSAITFALASGQPLHEVQDLAGHASPATTQRYNHARHRLVSSPAWAIAAHLARFEDAAASEDGG